MIGKTTSSSSPIRSPSSNGDHQASSKDIERLLPIANVSRLMKKTLPTSAKISKEAKETVQECVSEFISFITGEASDKCIREKRKTINGDDLLWAMTTLGFENYVNPLKKYLSKFRELEEDKTAISRQDHQDATNANDHQQQQFNNMNGHLGVVNSEGNNKREFEDFDQVVNFEGNSNKRLNGFDNGSVDANGVMLHNGLQW